MTAGGEAIEVGKGSECFREWSVWGILPKPLAEPLAGDQSGPCPLKAPVG